MSSEIQAAFQRAAIPVHRHSAEELEAFRGLALARRAQIEAALGDRARALLRRVEEELARFRLRRSAPGARGSK
jgi:hypothetical protein